MTTDASRRAVLTLSAVVETTRAVPALTIAMLEQIGWEIREVSIDLAAGRAVVRLHRHDGRHLYVAADASGKATVERWQRETTPTGSIRSDVVSDRFLGRSPCFGARSALRTMCDYIAENPAPGCAALPASTVRDSIRLLMAASEASS